MSNSKLTVREMVEDDIPLIANYWLNSDHDYLITLGVDLNKLPTREGLTKMLRHQLTLPYPEKQAYALIWEIDGIPSGHCNVNGIEFGENANMHLHLWKKNSRLKGLGQELVKLSIPYFFDNLKLQEIICEPYAKNPAPNKTLPKVGFTFIKEYITVPGSLNFEQPVSQWVLKKENFDR